MKTPAFAAAGAAVSSFAGRHVRRPAATSVVPPARAARARRNAAPVMKVYDVEILFHGEKYMIPVDEDETMLEGIEAHGLTVPYSCRAGVCMTCAAKIIEGEKDVDLGEIAMMDDLKGDGYVLTCSGKPLGEGIKLEMEHFDDVYERQYGQHEK